MKGLLEIVEELVQEHGSVNAAARFIGMPEATLHGVLRGHQPTVDTLRLIARARRQHLWKLVKEIEARSRVTASGD